MQRLRLYDCRMSRLPGVIGLCQSDVPTIANYVNSAQRRLLLAKEAGDEGWWGTWAEMLFTVSASTPYLTTPRSVARLEAVAVRDEVIDIQNQFYEYLSFGNGRMPKSVQTCKWNVTTAYTRNNVPTFKDLTNAPQIIRIIPVDPTDAGKRVLIQGTDSNGKVVRSIDTFNPVNGVFVTIEATSADAPTTFNTITGIQKDVTVGDVEIYQVDPTTGEDILILTMEPSEQTASYRRFYFDALPGQCCPSSTDDVTVTAIAKLDFIPVIVDTDYCLIQNLEAIIEECQSIRLSEMDSTDAKGQSRERHKAAIDLLNGELNHFVGTQKPAVSFFPFGSAHLNKIQVGRLF